MENTKGTPEEESTLFDTHKTSCASLTRIQVTAGILSICNLIGLYQIRYHTDGSYDSRKTGDPSWEIFFTAQIFKFVGGALLHLLSRKPSMKVAIIAAIPFVINVAFEFITFFRTNELLLSNKDLYNYCDSFNATHSFINGTTTRWFKFSFQNGNFDCPSWRYHVVLLCHSLLYFSSLFGTITSVWGAVICSQIVRVFVLHNQGKNVITRPNPRIKQGTLLKNSVTQYVLSTISMIFGVITLLILNYGVHSGKNDTRLTTLDPVPGFLNSPLRTGSEWALIASPCYFTSGVLSYFSFQLGYNSLLTSLLCLNAVNLLLAMGETSYPLLAFVARDDMSDARNYWLIKVVCF